MKNLLICLAAVLSVLNAGAGKWRIEGKVWPKNQTEPGEPLVITEDNEEPQPGRASVFGSPFAGTPIQFDDFKVEKVQ